MSRDGAKFLPTLRDRFSFFLVTKEDDTKISSPAGKKNSVKKKITVPPGNSSVATSVGSCAEHVAIALKVLRQSKKEKNAAPVKFSGHSLNSHPNLPPHACRSSYCGKQINSLNIRLPVNSSCSPMNVLEGLPGRQIAMQPHVWPSS